jgi:hypothetical protein
MPLAARLQYHFSFVERRRLSKFENCSAENMALQYQFPEDLGCHDTKLGMGNLEEAAIAWRRM